MSLRHYYLALTMIVLVAVGVRLAVIERFVGLDAPLSADDGLDQLDYELLAWRMASGEGYTLAEGVPTARRTPGTSLLIAPVYVMFGRSLVAARVWFALLSAATCAVVAWLLERSFGRMTALVGAAMLALNPGSFYYTLHLWSEPGYSLFLALGTALAVLAWRRDENWLPIALIAGMCWGVTLLIRPQVVFLLPFAAIVIWRLARIDRSRAIRQLVIQCAVVGAMAAPWVIRNAVVMGKPCLATVVGGMTFWGAHNEVTLTDPHWRGRWDIPDRLVDHELDRATSEIVKGQLAMDRAWTALRNQPAQIPILLVAKLYRLISPFEPTSNGAVYWSFALTWLATLPFVVLGLGELARRDAVLMSFIGSHLAGLALSALLFYGAARFRHALEPLFMVCAAVGLMWCVEHLRQWTPALTTAVARGQTPRRASVPSASP